MAAAGGLLHFIEGKMGAVSDRRAACFEEIK
jgi:hypothetical protein